MVPLAKSGLLVVGPLGLVLGVSFPCFTNILHVDLWLMGPLQWFPNGDLVTSTACLAVASGLTCDRGGVINMCRITLGAFPLRKALISVLLTFSLANIDKVLNVGPGWKLLVIVCRDPRLPVANVCKLRRICRFNRVSMLLGKLFGDRAMKHMLMFPE